MYINELTYLHHVRQDSVQLNVGYAQSLPKTQPSTSARTQTTTLLAQYPQRLRRLLEMTLLLESSGNPDGCCKHKYMIYIYACMA